MDSSKGELIVGYDYAEADSYTAVGAAYYEGGVLRVEVDCFFPLSRREMIETIVSWVKEFRPTQLYVRIGGSDKKHLISPQTVKDIIEGNLETEDLLVRP